MPLPIDPLKGPFLFSLVLFVTDTFSAEAVEGATSGKGYKIFSETIFAF